MNPAELAKVTADAGLTPSVQMLVVILGILVIAAGPAMLFLRDWKKRGRVDEIEGKQGDIQTGLYSHLYEQVTVLTTRLDKVHDEYNVLVRENATLRSRIQALESSEALVLKLRERLDEKDLMLTSRDSQVQQMFNDLRLRDQKIIELQERINKLELRLTLDEQSFCKNCQYNPQVPLKTSNSLR